MPRITVTITDDQAELLEEKTGEGGEYESKSEAVRSFIQEYERLSGRVEELETENQRLHRERRQLLEQREEHTDLVRAVESERTLAERRARAGLLTKAKWALFGMDDDEKEDRD